MRPWTNSTSLPVPESTPDAHYDGGETGCGELLLDLLLFTKRHSPGTTIEVRALDPGAPLEIPAWCRLTRHELISAAHPRYLIRTPLPPGEAGPANGLTSS